MRHSHLSWNWEKMSSRKSVNTITRVRMGVPVNIPNCKAWKTLPVCKCFYLCKFNFCTLQNVSEKNKNSFRYKAVIENHPEPHICTLLPAQHLSSLSKWMWHSLLELLFTIDREYHKSSSSSSPCVESRWRHWLISLCPGEASWGLGSKNVI